MNELARLLDLDKSSVTGLVDRAERRGLVTRVPSTADRDALSGLISRLLVAYAADHGIDLFATIDTGRPPAGG